MSLHYLLDGYNILHRMDLPSDLKLEDQRERLIRLVELRRPQGSSRNKVTIIFDGQQGVWGGHRSSEVQVLFSQSGSADDLIVRIVEKAKNRKVICVVTNDRAVERSAEVLGASVISVDEFLGRGVQKEKNPSGKETGSVKSIPSSAEYHINKELKEIWLGKKKPKGS